jgi:EAL domain-containing protein (putative c-di-GMP-specific phosphodiesterase class I)/GGDEF domain-containing protein
MITRSAAKQVLAYFTLFLFAILIQQYLLSISDPTQKALSSGQQGLVVSPSFFIDPSREMSLEQVLLKTNDFTKDELKNIPWSFDQQAYWIRLQVKNQGSIALPLSSHFANAMIEELDIYQISQEPKLLHTSLGWQQEGLSRLERSLPAYHFNLAPNQATDLYIRIATEGIAKTPIRLYLKDDFASLVSFSYLMWGSFVGILIAMSLYNLVLFWGLKDWVYLTYIGYISSVLIMLGVVIGFGHYIFPETAIRLMREHIVSANTSLMIFSLAFAILFFNAYRQPTRIVKLSLGFLIYLTAFALLSLFLPEYIAAPIFFLSMVFLYPIAFILIVQQFKKNYRWARLYLVSWLPLLIAGAIQPMGLTGVIKESFIVHHALMIGVLAEIVLMAMALAERMQYKKARALYKATHEPDTQLGNINLLEAKTQQLIDQKQRFALVIIELEGFSTLLPYVSTSDNNHLMVMLAKVIERNLHSQQNFVTLEYLHKQKCKVAKINEGTFALLVTLDSMEVKEQERIKRQLEFLSIEMEKGAQVGELLINLTTKLGCSILAVDDQNYSFAEHIKQAYQGLEIAKREARVIGFYQPDHGNNVAKRLALAADLQQALRNNELELYHQPQINLATQAIDGSEALLRWTHPEQGFIPPDIFIQLAEDTGVINELTLWVINTACQQLEELIRQGFTEHNVSVNISGKDIAEQEFMPKVRQILNRYNFPANSLTFELTESVMVNDFHHLQQTMAQLSELGVQVAIDDYGTGYSSLFYISQLPFNEIKIDKSFVINLADSERDLTIVRTTIEMAKSLGLKLVAEGIENQQIEDILKQHECHIVQGYYYQKPIPFGQFLDWLNCENQGR